MTDHAAENLAQIEALLVESLLLADKLDRPLLAAEIDKALSCARTMLGPESII